MGLVSVLLPALAGGQTPPCSPCLGVSVTDPAAALTALAAAPTLGPDDRLYVRWRHEAAVGWDPAPAAAVSAAGGRPWVALVFHTAPPLLEALPELEAELAGAAAVAASGAVDHFEVLWEPASPPAAGSADDDYAFLFKRAAVALTGAQPAARVLPAPLPADPALVAAFYGRDVAPYLDGVQVTPAGTAELAAVAGRLAELDPGRPLVVADRPWPEPAAGVLTAGAADHAAGAALTFFTAPPAQDLDLAPLAALARETSGDVELDPGTTPEGVVDAWTFVRGDDLSLRVVARAAPGSPALVLTFPDPLLGNPRRIDLASGEPQDLFGSRRTESAFVVEVTEPDEVVLLALDRVASGDLGSLEEELTVDTDRTPTVEEILRRLQAFEDAQARRIDHYTATNTTHLRFQGGGAGAVETSFAGPFFFRRGEGFDWVWEALYVNGVRWRGDRLPEIPLIQPEKAAAMPLDITFGPAYRYRLRGAGEAQGRPAWLVDFEPVDATVGGEQKLYQGTVWVDQEHFGRLQTRALQVGLQGDVISNEETMLYSPVDAAGAPADWDPASYWLPLRVVGQQIFSILNAATVVEKETLLAGLRINGPAFAERRQEALASEATMVRDTAAGLRYLVKDPETGERVVKEGFDTSKLFLAGGIFWDDSLDFPLPLAGIDWLSFDFRGTGTQTNVFFGGALLVADAATPDLFGTRFDAGIDTFAIAVPFTDSLYRGDEEIEAEDVEVRPASVELKLGHPVGSFARLGASYEATWLDYGRADDTAESFVVPSDHVLHSGELEGRFSRRGYRLTLAGSYNRRSSWDPWGTSADLAAFDPETDDFLRWSARLAKTFHLPKFQKLGLELDYLGGEDLDRFSKYQFGFFGGSRVHGYQSNRVRAEEVWAGHASYGLVVGELLRLEGVVDAALATDEAEGLSDELLAGVGLVGSFIGPWQTVVQLDLGVPVAGPDDGFVLYLVFLKLFR